MKKPNITEIKICDHVFERILGRFNPKDPQEFIINSLKDVTGDFSDLQKISIINEDKDIVFKGRVYDNTLMITTVYALSNYSHFHLRSQFRALPKNRDMSKIPIYVRRKRINEEKVKGAK